MNNRTALEQRTPQRQPSSPRHSSPQRPSPRHFPPPVPAELVARAAHQCGLVAVQQCRAAGLDEHDMRALLRNGWSRVTRGVFDTTPNIEHSLDARRRRAGWLAILAYGPGAIAVGQCALALHGVQGLPAQVPPEVALVAGSDRESRNGIRVRQFAQCEAGALTLPAGRVVSIERALAQAVPELALPNALAVLDSAFHLGLCDSEGLNRARELARGRRGCAARRRLWALADGRAESPLESFARLDCIDAGVAPDSLQLPIVDRFGRDRARGDMAWHLPDGRWLVAEVDGVEFHSGPEAIYADRRRQNAIMRSGKYSVLRFTARDIPGIGRSIRATLAG